MPLFWKPPGIQAMPEGGGSHWSSWVFFNHHRLVKNPAKWQVSNMSLPPYQWVTKAPSNILSLSPSSILYLSTHTDVYISASDRTSYRICHETWSKWQNSFFFFFWLDKTVTNSDKILIFVPLLLLLSGTICERICGASCQWCDVDPWQSKQSEIEEHSTVVVLLPVSTAVLKLMRKHCFPFLHLQTR